MSDELIFEEPPPKATSSPSTWMVRLKARPGEWAILPIKSYGGSTFYKRRGFEVVSRTVDGERRFYGRFVGVNGEHK